MDKQMSLKACEAILQQLGQVNTKRLFWGSAQLWWWDLRGANWGPLFLRSTLVEQQPQTSAFDLGDVRVIPHLLHDVYLNEQTISNCQSTVCRSKSDYYVSPLSITEDVCDGFYANHPDKGIFGIGGDHSISYPLTKSYLKAK